MSSSATASRRFPTRDAAKHAVIEFIEADYNRRRPHSTIGYQVSAQAMDSFFEWTKQAEEELLMTAQFLELPCPKS